MTGGRGRISGFPVVFRGEWPDDGSRVIRHLYVHIPFCPKICPYCSFYKEVSDRNKTPAFLDALLAEVDSLRQRFEVQPRTIFFGGGTPSALSTPQLDYLLRGLKTRLDLSALTEWTLEMNPATVSLEKAALLRGLGVNRISMGVQSWDPALLKTLGRVHDREQAERSYRILREAGFDNVNLDLIFGVPGQSMRQWRDTLRQTIEMGPQHISAYCLTYEEDTEYFRQLQIGSHRPDDEHDADLFDQTMADLVEAGYEQYEISNYARPGRECRHNLAYWLGDDYLGIGPSAFSTVGLERWQNQPDAAGYSEKIRRGDSAVSFHEALDPATKLAERIMFSLRTNRGVSRSEVAAWPEEVATFTDRGLMESRDSRLVLTRRGRMVADHIAEAFI